jgi:hypothetical protein
MKWKKLGLVYRPKGESDWMHSHAYIPTPFRIDQDTIRLYVAFWDREKVGRIGYVDVDANNPISVKKVSDKPVLDIGDPGMFDDNGVTPGSVVKLGNKVLLYYIGWQIGIKVRYYLFTGLAISEDNGNSFRRFSKVPILDRSHKEPFFRTAPFVIHDNKKFKMWYIAGDKWSLNEGKKMPNYNMRYLESNNGFEWPQSGTVCLDTESKDEFGLGRPYVIKEDHKYCMFFSIRSFTKGYSLGYAESDDGLVWSRKDDELGIGLSKIGWDSQMMSFSSIIDVEDQRYMFYNGNNFGEDGFGVAVMEK